MLIKNFFNKKPKQKPNNPIAGLENTEMEVTVKRKDGSLKAYRKVVNKKEVKVINK